MVLLAILLFSLYFRRLCGASWSRNLEHVNRDHQNLPFFFWCSLLLCIICLFSPQINQWTHSSLNASFPFFPVFLRWICRVMGVLLFSLFFFFVFSCSPCCFFFFSPFLFSVSLTYFLARQFPNRYLQESGKKNPEMGRKERGIRFIYQQNHSWDGFVPGVRGDPWPREKRH